MYQTKEMESILLKVYKSKFWVTYYRVKQKILYLGTETGSFNTDSAFKHLLMYIQLEFLRNQNSEIESEGPVTSYNAQVNWMLMVYYWLHT